MSKFSSDAMTTIVTVFHKIDVLEQKCYYFLSVLFFLLDINIAWVHVWSGTITGTQYDVQQSMMTNVITSKYSSRLAHYTSKGQIFTIFLMFETTAQNHPFQYNYWILITYI